MSGITTVGTTMVVTTVSCAATDGDVFIGAKAINTEADSTISMTMEIRFNIVLSFLI